MARLSESAVDRIKLGVSLVDLASTQGYTLKSQGAELVLCCPFHEDKTPSCYINPTKNVFYCHGCGEKGDVIQWWMKTEGVAFREACEQLTEKFGLIDSCMLQPASDQVLLRQVLNHYQSTLRSSVAAQEYLKKRGLYDAELVQYFQLGFADASLMKLIPGSRRTSQPLREQLKKIGLLRATGYEFLEGCVVVPIFDGQLISQMYGRRINPGKQRIKHLYLPQPQTGLWNADAYGQPELILCESLIDAMTFWVQGFRNVTTCFGAKSLSEAQLTALREHGVQSVKVAFDGDAAGDGAALAVAAQLTKENIACYRVQFPQGMDANSFALKMPEPADALQTLLRAAILLTAPTPSSSSAADLVKEPAPMLLSSIETHKTEPVLTESGDDIHTALGDRHYRIRGLDNNTNRAHLKINLLVKANDLVYIDHVDLYLGKSRLSYLNQAVQELGLSMDVLKADLAKLLPALEALQKSRDQQDQAPETVTLTPAETEQAMELLQDPNLMGRILKDLNTLGVVGEETNKLVGYLAASSRKLEKPLAVMIQSTSAAGKSALMDVVLRCMPPEERVHYSAMTGQSLFYMGETNLKYKILSVAEEEGAEQASYALKLLQSEGEIRIASTGKDPKTGQLVTQEYRVEGPVMLFMTTTAIDVDPELLNRCLTLTVNESRTQTEAIHDGQRDDEMLDGLFTCSSRDDLLVQHQNAQRLLEPVNIVNPYANRLTFPSDQTRTRRDHKKYLTLIRCITLLHQHQRPIKTATRDGVSKDYIEVTLDDIRWANRLAHEVMGRTLDELPPQTRKLLREIYHWVRSQLARTGLAQSDFRFTRKQIREATRWGNTQLKVHLARLEDLEYLYAHSGSRGKTIHYELMYDGENDDDQPHLSGLIDVDLLADEQEILNKSVFGVKKSGVKVEKSGSSRPQSRTKVGPSRDKKSDEYSAIQAQNAKTDGNSPESTTGDGKKSLCTGQSVQEVSHGG